MFYKLLLNVIFRILFFLKSIMGKDSIENGDKSDGYSFRAFRYARIEPRMDGKRKVPLPRSGHRIVCDTKNLYSFGGYNPSTQPDPDVRNEDDFAIQSFPLLQELWKFNFASKKWSRLSSRETLPQELASNAVIREGNYMMVYACVYGGTGSPFGERCSNQLYICMLNDGKGKMCEVSTTGQLPLPQYGQALVYHNNYLYTIGGTTGFTYTCDIHRLNMKTQVWESVYICQGQTDSEPLGRYRHEVAFNGREIFILGGGTAELAFDFDKLPVFDIEKREWSHVKTISDTKGKDDGYPPARRCHGAVQIEVNNKLQVFISGGFDGYDFFDDLWKLDLQTMQWTMIETCKLPFPTYFHSSAVNPEGKMYIFGGIFMDEEVKRNNLVHATWLCIPKLSEMCWEALLFYKPELVESPREKLLDAGLPRHFVNRLE